MARKAVEGAFAVTTADERPTAEAGEPVIEVAFGLAGSGHDLGERGRAEVFDGAKGLVVVFGEAGDAPGVAPAAAFPELPGEGVGVPGEGDLASPKSRPLSLRRPSASLWRR